MTLQRCDLPNPRAVSIYSNTVSGLLRHHMLSVCGKLELCLSNTCTYYQQMQTFSYSSTFGATSFIKFQGYRYHKLRKTFSKFYRRHYELISKYNVGLKTLLSEGLSEPEFYGDLVYKLKKLKGINDFSLQFGKIISRYRRIGYNLNVMRQSACLVFNPIMVDNYAAFFNCTPVGRASDSMMAPT